MSEQDTLPPPARAVLRDFVQRHGALPEWLVRSPGRVNLIGEHTDYNDGFVLPLAIDRAVWIALSPRDEPAIDLHALDEHASGTISLTEFVHTGPSWLEYVRGAAWALHQEGHALRGWIGSLSGDVPRGAGLSSSAAVELASLRALAAVSDLPWDPARMALLGQQAENVWVGVRCGIMDQMISAAGQSAHALLIDCRSLATTPVPMPDDVVVVVMDTSTRRGLMDSAYNERRQQCEQAARHFSVPALRDVSTERWDRLANGLDVITRRRARHVISENNRTREAAHALTRGAVDVVGRLMGESHRSLRDDFEVSSTALDVMVGIAQSQSGCLGARMTGAGFGGCAVALVQRLHADAFVASVAARYRAATAREPALYVTTAQPGTQAWSRTDIEKRYAG